MNNKTIVIIPTYNEVENISRIIDHVLSQGQNIDILVVDDNSPDGTSSIVSQKKVSSPNRIFLIERLNKKGLGTAYISGFKWALEKKYDFIISMDADFSHNPNELPTIIKYFRKGVDIVVGSRYLDGVSVVNWPIGRIFLSYIAQIYVRLITGMPINDPTSGFVAYSAKCIDSLNLEKFKFIGYAFQIEMKYKLWKKNFKLKEHQIIFMNRELGESKLDKRIILEAVFGVLQLRLKSIFNRL